MAGLTFKVRTEGLNNLPKDFAKSATRTEEKLAQKVAADTEQYVPALNLSLANRTQVVGNAVIYPGPYARYLYYGKVMVYKDPPVLRPRKKDGKMVLSHYGQTKYPIDVPLKFNKSKHKNAQAFWFEASKAANISKWNEFAAKEIAKNGK